jgi:hypothetical protein
VPDSYLSIAAIASDPYMSERVRACAAQQSELGSVDIDEPIAWTASERYVWAASPGWGEAWSYAIETHPPDPPDEFGNTTVYEPGKDDTVITDGQILATVQALAPAGSGKS